MSHLSTERRKSIFNAVVRPDFRFLANASKIGKCSRLGASEQVIEDKPQGASLTRVEQ